MATKAELEETCKRQDVEIGKLKTTITNQTNKYNSDSLDLRRTMCNLEKQMEAKTESCDYMTNKLHDIRVSLETVAAVEFPDKMLAFDCCGNDQSTKEPELLLLLRHLYRLTN